MIQGKKEENKYLSGNVFEGMLSVRAVCDGYGREGSRKITRVLFDESRLPKKALDLALLRRLGEVHGFPVELVSKETIDGMTVGSSHGGIVAECTERPIPTLRAEDLPDNGFFVLLDGVEDPYNFGFALRSLYAAGVDGVVLPPRNWMTAASVVCRSSAGASERMPLYTADEVTAVRLMKEKGYRIVCAEMKDSQSLYDTAFARPMLLVIGGEKRGIKREVVALSDVRVRIEYGRDFDGALSAVSAATVIAFEAMRQMKGH